MDTPISLCFLVLTKLEIMQYSIPVMSKLEYTRLIIHCADLKITSGLVLGVSKILIHNTYRYSLGSFHNYNSLSDTQDPTEYFHLARSFHILSR